MDILTFAQPEPTIATRLTLDSLPEPLRFRARCWQARIADLGLPSPHAASDSMSISMSVAASAKSSGASVAIAIADPLHCLLAIVAVHDLGMDAFLCDPSWPEVERCAVLRPIAPTVTFQDRDIPSLPRSSASPNIRPTRPDREPYIAIPTGGTTGQKRFACHTWSTLAASAIGVREAFQRDRIDSFCCLPTFHVSGLAQFVRAIVSGGRLGLAAPGSLRPDRPVPIGDFSGFWLSLVPTQLQRLLDCPPDRADWARWLRQFDVIFLGGAPAWPELLDRARSLDLRLAPTFGMTETGSQIATLHPDDFLAGRSGCGRVLPHAEIAIEPLTEASRSRENRDSTPIGTIAIRAKSLCHGYYDPELGRARPLTDAEGRWRSDDLGYRDRDGFFHIAGRASQKVITGGENVYPEEVEAAIRATGLVDDVAVVGLPDREWGQALAAVFVPRGDCDREAEPGANRDRHVAQIRDRLQAHLARYKIPKRWQAVAALPRNDRGKLDRAALAQFFDFERAADYSVGSTKRTKMS